MPFPPKKNRAARGFTLIEVVVVLLIVGVVIAMAAAITRGISAGQKRSLTNARMAAVDAALLQFVQQTKRLPCPGDGTLLSTHADAGLEVRHAASGVCTANGNPPVNLLNGVLPWRTLGLSEADALDGWDRRLTYRLQPELAANNAMDMSWCDPAGTGIALVAGACNTACTSSSAAGLAQCTLPYVFLSGKGLAVRRADGVTVAMSTAAAAGTPHTGAAYLVISHGESGGGAYLPSGQLQPSTVTDGTEEVRNYANAAYAAGTYYIDDSLNDVSGTAHFDDIISRPALLSLINKAGLGPRQH